MDLNTNLPNENGTIRISSDVISTIASVATLEVKGITMSGGLTNDIAEKFGVKSSTKGIKVQVNDSETIIDVFIIVEYGLKIPQVALEVQDNIKKSVEGMTGLNVKEVNIHIQGILTSKDTKEEAHIQG